MGKKTLVWMLCVAAIACSLMTFVAFTRFKDWMRTQAISPTDITLFVHSSKWEGKVYINRTEINVPQGTVQRDKGYVDALIVDVTIANKLSRNIELACSVFDQDTKQGFSSLGDGTTVPLKESLAYTKILAQISRRGILTYAVPKGRTNLILDCSDGITQTLKLE